MHSKTLNRLQEIMRLVFEETALLVTDSTTARDVEAWDSLANIELLVAVEREFGVELPLAEAVRFEDVGALAIWLDSQQQSITP